MLICITECWETRVTIIDKYLSCLRNQTQLLETGTQHYQVADAGYSGTAKSSFTCRHTSNVTCSAGDLFLPSFSAERVHASNSVVTTQCWDKKQPKHSKTAKAVASPTMKSFSPLPTLLQMELKILLIKGQTSAQTSTDIHRAITGSPLLQNIPVHFFP